MTKGKVIWQPTEQFKAEANLTAYMKWLAGERGHSFPDYQSLWKWSAEKPAEFWKSLWDYFEVIHDGTFSKVLQGEMPQVRWFEGTRLNYAEHIFRHATGERPAIIFGSETGDVKTKSWTELSEEVSAVQQFMKDAGVKTGDAVAAYVPCIPEATVAMLAAASLGATWSSCSPDFGTHAVFDRFAQIKPKVLFAVDRYRYGGKEFDRSETLRQLIERIPSLERVVVINGRVKAKGKEVEWEKITARSASALTFERVPFSHPLWVLYSSGTTGLPKAITHSHGGILLEQLKYGTFHNDFKPGEHCFWYTTTGWMMWNYIHGALLAGGVMVLYDGSPGWPDLDVLWKFAAAAGIHHFGTSAGFLLANRKAGLKPRDHFNLAALRSIGSTGSTLPPEGFEWVYEAVKDNLWLTSMSGGTDVCSAFVGGNPLWPVRIGEIQCRALGCNLEAFDEEGNVVRGQPGEMVIRTPMPSMPAFLWNDPDFVRYRESYFEMFPGVWRHGDWIEITENDGVVIYGRSDATLNRAGVRIGTSEIYRAVDTVEEVRDSLIICVERKDGSFWMPLFVAMKQDQPLTDALREKINKAIRTAYSPRHVPDEILAIPDVPYTISGKKTELPVKKIFMGDDPARVVNKGTLRNPECIPFFEAILKERHHQ